MLFFQWFDSDLEMVRMDAERQDGGAAVAQMLTLLRAQFRHSNSREHFHQAPCEVLYMLLRHSHRCVCTWVTCLRHANP